MKRFATVLLCAGLMISAGIQTSGAVLVDCQMYADPVGDQSVLVGADAVEGSEDAWPAVDVTSLRMGIDADTLVVTLAVADVDAPAPLAFPDLFGVADFISRRLARVDA